MKVVGQRVAPPCQPESQRWLSVPTVNPVLPDVVAPLSPFHFRQGSHN